MKNTKRMEENVNATVDEILDEDKENEFDASQSDACPENCEELDDTPKEEITQQCKCGIENSLRFSLRVMEAMRLLQRDPDQPCTSSAEDIVDYIRSNYRSDGDLYAQVRTALRQVCSQGFVIEILNNEYHLIGPIVNLMKQYGTYVENKDYKSSTINNTSKKRKNINNHKTRFFRGNLSPRECPKNPHKESLRKTFVADYPEDSSAGSIYSRRISQRDTIGKREIEQNDEHMDSVPGPSKEFLKTSLPIPTKNAKKARLDDRRVQYADENNEETSTEEDLKCACGTNAQVTRTTHSRRRRSLNRNRVIKNQRNGRRRRGNDEKYEEDEEDEEDEENEEREEDEGVKEEDGDTDDSVYEELKTRIPRKRTKARERELKRWIRRCRQECERRRER